MKKKVVSAILAIVMVFSLVACAGNREPDNPVVNDATKGVTESKPVDVKEDGTVYILHKGLDFYAWIAMQEAVVRYAEDNNIDIQVLNAKNDVATQVEQFQNILTQNPKAIITTAVDSESLTDSVKQANGMGIPVAVYDTPITGEVNIDITVDCDNYMAGKQAAEMIVDKLKEKYDGEVKGKILNAYGDLASQVMRERKEGFDDVFTEYPDIKIVEVAGYGDRLKSQEAASNALASNDDIIAVHAPCDNAFYGVYEAVDAAGKLKKVGEDDHIIMVSLDGEPEVLDRITAGYVDGTVNLDWHAVAAICLELLEQTTFKGEDLANTYNASDSYFKFYWDSADIIDADDWNGKYLSLPTTKIWEVDAQNDWNSGRYSADVLGINY